MLISGWSGAADLCAWSRVCPHAMGQPWRLERSKELISSAMQHVSMVQPSLDTYPVGARSTAVFPSYLPSPLLSGSAPNRSSTFTTFNAPMDQVKSPFVTGMPASTFLSCCHQGCGSITTLGINISTSLAQQQGHGFTLEATTCQTELTHG